MRMGHAAIGVDRPGGAAIASTSLFARSVDWAALGAMIVNAGVWRGKRFVSAAWITAMTTLSPANAHYGLRTWLGDHAVGGTPLPPTLTPWQSVGFAAPDMVLMNGFGGQRVWMRAGKRLVVVRTGRTCLPPGTMPCCPI